MSYLGLAQSDYRDASQKLFEWAPNLLDVNAPGGQGGSLSSYLTWTARRELIGALSTAADRANKANEAEARRDHAEAKRPWRIILGTSFPN